MNPTNELLADAKDFLSLDATKNTPSVACIVTRLLARVRELEAERGPLMWTDAKPTVDGRYYWFRYVPEDIGEIVYFRDGRINLECGLHRVEEIAGQFAGPISKPAESK